MKGKSSRAVRLKLARPAESEYDEPEPSRRRGKPPALLDVLLPATRTRGLSPMPPPLPPLRGEVGEKARRRRSSGLPWTCCCCCCCCCWPSS